MTYVHSGIYIITTIDDIFITHPLHLNNEKRTFNRLDLHNIQQHIPHKVTQV